MLEEGIIERSTSEWSAPVVPVKDDKSLRICMTTHVSTKYH